MCPFGHYDVYVALNLWDIYRHIHSKRIFLFQCGLSCEPSSWLNQQIFSRNCHICTVFHSCVDTVYVIVDQFGVEIFSRKNYMKNFSHPYASSYVFSANFLSPKVFHNHRIYNVVHVHNPTAHDCPNMFYLWIAYLMRIMNGAIKMSRIVAKQYMYLCENTHRILHKKNSVQILAFFLLYPLRKHDYDDSDPNDFGTFDCKFCKSISLCGHFVSAHRVHLLFWNKLYNYRIYAPGYHQVLDNFMDWIGFRF